MYNGKERELFSNPLEDYYTGGQKRPDYLVAPLTTSSGNWRGYVATWLITDGKLYLTKIDSWICTGETKKSCSRVTLSSIFGKKVKKGRVLADWFTGELRIPDGKELQYVHMGYGSTYERDIIFTAKLGDVTGPYVIDNTTKELPSELEAARRELEKLKAAEERKMKPTEKPAKRRPLSGITITPGQGIFKYGTKRVDLEAVVGEGDAESPYEDVYFVEYPAAGVQASYDNGKDTVHVIFLYNNAPHYPGFAIPEVRTEKGISWTSTGEDILKAYGKPLKDFSDDSKTWRRLEYPGIDFLFQGGQLERIGILGPDGN